MVGGGDMGIELDIFGGPIDAKGVDLSKPKYASVDPVTVKVYREDEEEEFKQYSVELTFLGDGFLELRAMEYLLCDQGFTEVYFAGIHGQGRKAVKRVADEFDEVWRNDVYTGRFHPDNNKRLKAAMEEYGIPDDTQDSSSGSEEDEDDD
jgi:hypothetical protein